MDYFIIFWGFLLIGLMAIGGFFMFRKFLKMLHIEDGKSMMDWEILYMEKTKQCWKKNKNNCIEKIVFLVQNLFKDVPQKKFARKIGKVQLKKNEPKLTREL